jgi:HlyD family secretion protein
MQDSARMAQFARSTGVVLPAGWISLGVIAAVVVAAVAWSFFGSVPTKVISRCIVMSASGVAEVSASASGRVLEVTVKSGDLVRPGQVIGAIAQPELDERIRRARARAAELQERARSIALFSKRGLELSDEALAKKSESLVQQRLVAQSRVKIAAEQNVTTRQLLDQGLVTRRAVDNAARELRGAEIVVREIERQISEIARARMDTQKRESDERSGIQLELAEAQREVTTLEQDGKRSSAVVSAFEGRVIEVKAGRGMLVAKDASIVTLERTGKGAGPLEVVMYVAAADGKKILPGAQAHVMPATVRREERGHLLGEVRSVSDYPATPQSLLATLGNEELVREVASMPAPFEVRVNLLRDDAGYLWSERGSDPPALRVGTLCGGEIVVRKERPVGFVIPALRREQT